MTFKSVITCIVDACDDFVSNYKLELTENDKAGVGSSWALKMSTLFMLMTAVFETLPSCE